MNEFGLGDLFTSQFDLESPLHYSSASSSSSSSPSLNVMEDNETPLSFSLDVTPLFGSTSNNEWKDSSSMFSMNEFAKQILDPKGYVAPEVIHKEAKSNHASSTVIDKVNEILNPKRHGVKRKRVCSPENRDVRRRLMHRKTDKERRNRIAAGIEELQSVLVTSGCLLPDERFDRATIVQASAEYVKQLKQDNDNLRKRLALFEST